MRPLGYGECQHCGKRSASGACREARWCLWSRFTKVAKGDNCWTACTVTVSPVLPLIEDDADRDSFYDRYRSGFADE